MLAETTCPVSAARRRTPLWPSSVSPAAATRTSRTRSTFPCARTVTMPDQETILGWFDCSIEVVHWLVFKFEFIQCRSREQLWGRQDAVRGQLGVKHPRGHLRPLRVRRQEARERHARRDWHQGGDGCLIYFWIWQNPSIVSLHFVIHSLWHYCDWSPEVTLIPVVVIIVGSQDVIVFLVKVSRANYFINLQPSL